VESGFEFGITCYDTMINYQLSQKLELLKNGEFNHLTNIITSTILFLHLLAHAKCQV
jgi:hypothetical protein